MTIREVQIDHKKANISPVFRKHKEYREPKASPCQLNGLEGDGPNNPGNNFHKPVKDRKVVGNWQPLFMKENHAWPTC